ncbi:MAG TPA: flavoprotein [Trebonia sp.]|jgi:phosphopantothenoylcysteine synthetase/decarboxylase|nr:flavoprotein [Trebonia sp.]
MSEIQAEAVAEREHVLSVVVCAAAPAASVATLVREAVSRGWAVQVIATPSALPFFDAGEIGEIAGRAVRSQYSKPGDPRSKIPEAIIVAPATFNTINQWALGISDTYALGVLAEQAGMEIPIVVVPFVSEALAGRPPFQRSIKALRAEGVSILIGIGAIQPHPVHTEDEHAASFPWVLALDEVSGMTGFGFPPGGAPADDEEPALP